MNMKKKETEDPMKALLLSRSALGEIIKVGNPSAMCSQQELPLSPLSANRTRREKKEEEGLCVVLIILNGTRNCSPYERRGNDVSHLFGPLHNVIHQSIASFLCYYLS
jgi:hypothetical protein